MQKTHILGNKQVQYVFLDSGVGGLPYLQTLLEVQPDSSAVYVADTKHFPYGKKTKDEVQQYSYEIVQEIVDKLSPSIIIIACNTITVCALEHLRASFSIPFVGTVPAIKTAAQLTQTKNIALIGTKRTVEDEYIRNMKKEVAQGCSIFPSDEGELVKEIEEGLAFATLEAQVEAVLPIVRHFESLHCDALVLGCTHFLHLRSAFIQAGKMCSPQISIADSLLGVVKQAMKVSPYIKNNTCASCRAFYASAIQYNKDEKRYRMYAEHAGLTFLQDLASL